MNGASGRDSLTFSVFLFTVPWGPWDGRGDRVSEAGDRGGEAGCPGGRKGVTAHNPWVLGTRTKRGHGYGARDQGQVTA